METNVHRILLALAALIFSSTLFAGEIAAEEFRSELLGRPYRYTVYLPDAYGKKGAEKRSFPVLYLLHGSVGDERAWLAQGGLRETMDALIARRQIQPMLVVMPGHSESWWVDGAAEKAESALLGELMPHAESKYRIDAAHGQRMVAGLSAGGYGALNLALRHPRLFAAAALLSPAIYEPLPPAHSSALRHAPFQKDGRFDPALWQSLNYPAHLEAYKKSGAVVPFYIVSGDHDVFGIALQAAMLYEKLRRYQPDAVELRISDGDHEWMLWRDAIGDALQFMNGRLLPPARP